MALISYAEASAILAGETRPLAVERRPLAALASCVAAETVLSPVRVPGFDNTAMDGYALRSADIAGASATHPAELAIAGSVAAGDLPPASTPPGTAWEIMTGAALPPDCDAVVPVEDVSVPRPGVVRVVAATTAGRHVRRAGEDFAIGQPVVGAGRALDPEAIMALAATGIETLAVRPPPRIGVLTTGSELRSGGDPLRSGLIRDSNGPYLRASCAALGLPPVMLASVEDEVDLLTHRLADMAAHVDVLLTTGGVSAGRLDHVPAALAALGARVWFHKVAIRPAKPLLAAQLPGGPLCFGLPGNPVSVAVALRFFVVPALRLMQGLPGERATPARNESTTNTPARLHFFAKARRQAREDGQLTVRLLPGQESFRIAPLLEANCWASIPSGQAVLAEGLVVDTLPLRPEP